MKNDTKRHNVHSVPKVKSLHLNDPFNNYFYFYKCAVPILIFSRYLYAMKGGWVWNSSSLSIELRYTASVSMKLSNMSSSSKINFVTSSNPSLSNITLILLSYLANLCFYYLHLFIVYWYAFFFFILSFLLFLVVLCLFQLLGLLACPVETG